MVDIHLRVTRLMVDNDGSGAVTADIAINLSSQSAVIVGLPLPSCDSQEICLVPCKPRRPGEMLLFSFSSPEGV
ncbi:hypothetical protein TNCV_3132801 [Trichonephila clavipes]|nr:hypothetical protein TNCV_3132801 [Trichonephila clavipes]